MALRVLGLDEAPARSLRASRRSRIAPIVRRAPAAPKSDAREGNRSQWLKAGLTTAVLAASLTGLIPLPLTLGAVALTAIPSFKRAYQNLRRKRANVDVLDAAAIAICLARAEPVTASVITTLLACGDIILDRTQDRARKAISRLLQLDDGEAFRLDEDGVPVRVKPAELAKGDRIVIYPGARIPADGVLVEGSLGVDEKAITGESVPRERFVGERVMAASVAVHGQATVLVERAGHDTIAARIVRILEGAGAKPMTLQRGAEGVADKLVLPTFGIAGGAWALSGVVDRATSVIITDFGTGIRVAVPTAALAAMTLAARKGVLVKGATYLQRLAEADTVVFDKTGTLTLGVPEVTKVVALSRISPAGVLALAAAAEGNQSHPIALAIRRHAERTSGALARTAHRADVYRIGLGLEAIVDGRRVTLGSARMMRGVGIDPSASDAAREELASRGQSCVLVAVDGALAGVVAYADAPRPESRAVVLALKAGGRRRVILLSGDARAPALAVARAIGIDEAIAEVLPAEKADVIHRLRAEGRKVAMVGDGINDAPALAAADVGISLHGGTDAALETADVVLLEGGLERLPAMFDVADSAMSRVRRVLGMVVVPNSFAIIGGALGLVNPVAAAIFNNGSTLFASVYAAAPLLSQKPR